MQHKTDQIVYFSKNKLCCDLLLSLCCCLLYSSLVFETIFAEDGFVYSQNDQQIQEINISIGYPILPENESFHTSQNVTHNLKILQLLQSIIITIICSSTLLNLAENLIKGNSLVTLILDPGLLIDLLSGAFVLLSIVSPAQVAVIVPLFLQSFNARNAFILLLMKHRENSDEQRSNLTSWSLRRKLAVFCDTICVLYCVATLHYYLETICMQGNLSGYFSEYVTTVARNGIFYAFNPFTYFGRLLLSSCGVMVLAFPEIKCSSKVIL